MITNPKGAGRKPRAGKTQVRTVRLTDIEHVTLKIIGDGNATAGIRALLATYKPRDQR